MQGLDQNGHRRADIGTVDAVHVAFMPCSSAAACTRASASWWRCSAGHWPLLAALGFHLRQRLRHTRQRQRRRFELPARLVEALVEADQLDPGGGSALDKRLGEIELVLRKTHGTVEALNLRLEFRDLLPALLGLQVEASHAAVISRVRAR